MPALDDPRYEAFARYFSQGKSKRDAAIEAGFSQKNASTIGGRLYKKVEICRRIAELQSKAEQRTVEITTASIDRVLKEYGRIAFLDIRRAFDDEGNLKPIKDLDDETAAAIAGFEVEQLFSGRGSERKRIGVLKKIKLTSKLGALDSLGKHLGLFKSDDQSAPDGLLKELADAIKNSPDK